MIPIIKYRAWGFVFSGLIAGAALVSLLMWGLNLGIDFTGGSLMEIEFRNGSAPHVDEVRAAASESLGTTDIFVQPLGENGMVLRMPTLEEEQHQVLVDDLRAALNASEPSEGAGTPTVSIETEDGTPIEIEAIGSEDGETGEEDGAAEGLVLAEHRFESVGPIIGEELRRKTIYAVVGAILAVVLYITYVFRRVSKPVSAWKYGACTVAALTHDVLIPVGAYAALGHFYNVEVGAWIVTALLTILGFSVHDTIVVFDRIRENLGRHRRESFEETVNRSVNESIARSVNTSVTLLFVLVAAYVLGGESLKHFLMIMIIGISAGTYSSIFVASPLLVTWQLHDKARKNP